jgi:DNA polymerase
VLHTDAAVSALRGRVHRVRVAGRDVPAIVTYHPAYLLRNLADKAKAWADLCLALDVEAGSPQ